MRVRRIDEAVAAEAGAEVAQILNTCDRRQVARTAAYALARESRSRYLTADLARLQPDRAFTFFAWKFS